MNGVDDHRADGDSSRRIQGILLDEPAGLVICVAMFLAVCGYHALNLTFLHDEGSFTYVGGRFLFREFWASLFVHKLKPANILIESIPASMGFIPYLLWHSAISAAALVLASQTARAMKLSHPNGAAWFLATCGIFAVGASNGFANNTGAAFTALFLYLYEEGLLACGLFRLVHVLRVRGCERHGQTL